MPTIGWFEILLVVAVAIVVIGPKDFPFMLKKVGSWIGTTKRYISNIQNEVTDLEIDSDDIEKPIEKKKMTIKSDNEGGFVSHLAELRKRLIHSFIFLFIFFIFCYFFSEYLYGFLVEPFAKAVKDSGNFYSITRNLFNIFEGFIFCSIFCNLSLYFNANLEIYCSRSLQA